MQDDELRLGNPDDTDLVKDGAAAMRTLGNSIDTSFVDLKGGTTGQVLAKASNTDLDFTWTAGGDITGVTAGTGITGGGTSGTVTITNDMATKIDAKGDLIVGTGADTYDRLAVGGTNAHVLQVDSTAATGMKWAAVPSSAKSYTLLNSPSGTTMSGSGTVTVNISSGYDNLLIMLMDTSSANADSYFYWRFNGDTGAGQYLYAGGAFKAPSTYSANISDKHESGTGGQTEIETIQTASNAGSAGSVGMNVFGANSTGFKAFQLSGNANTGSGNDQQGVAVSGIYKGSAAITSVSVRSSSGNFDTGTIFIYGA